MRLNFVSQSNRLLHNVVLNQATLDQTAENVTSKQKELFDINRNSYIITLNNRSSIGADHQFRRFAVTYRFARTTNSLRYLQPKTETRRAVRTMKGLLRNIMMITWLFHISADSIMPPPHDELTRGLTKARSNVEGEVPFGNSITYRASALFSNNLLPFSELKYTSKYCFHFCHSQYLSLCYEITRYCCIN